MSEEEAIPPPSRGRLGGGWGPLPYPSHIHAFTHSLLSLLPAFTVVTHSLSPTMLWSCLHFADFSLQLTTRAMPAETGSRSATAPPAPLIITPGGNQPRVVY